MIKVSTVCILLNEDREIWMMRRTDKCRDEHGNWDLCAGGLEEGLTAEDNMRKELQEELGISPPVTFLGYRDVFRMIGADSPHYVGLDFLARVRSDEPACQEPENHDASGWFSAHDLPAPLHSQVPFFLAKYQEVLWPSWI